MKKPKVCHQDMMNSLGAANKGPLNMYVLERV